MRLEDESRLSRDSHFCFSRANYSLSGIVKNLNDEAQVRWRGENATD